MNMNFQTSSFLCILTPLNPFKLPSYMLKDFLKFSFVISLNGKFLHNEILKLLQIIMFLFN